jgi:hypothetical protein
MNIEQITSMPALASALFSAAIVRHELGAVRALVGPVRLIRCDSGIVELMATGSDLAMLWHSGINLELIPFTPIH